jgi:hypothetical protein
LFGAPEHFEQFKNNLSKRQKTVAGLRAGNSFYIVPGRVQFCAIKKKLSDRQLGRSGK